MRHRSATPARDGPISLDVISAVCARAGELAEREDDPEAAVGAALRAIHDGLEDASVALFVVEHASLWLIDSAGFTIIPDGLGFDEGVVGRAMRTGRAQLVPDVAADEDYVEAAPGIVSELVLPLVVGGETVGVLDVETSVSLPLGADRAASTLAGTLSAIVARLSIGRTGDLSMLARLFVYLGSLREPATISEVVTRSMARLLSVDAVQLFLTNESDSLAELGSWQALADHPLTVTASSARSVRDRFAARAAVELVDTERDGIDEFAGSGVRALVLAPLRASGHEIGLLVGQSRTAKDFDRRAVEAVSLLAAHAGASLDAAFALDRERRSALTDSLTGLMNRRGFEQRLELWLERAQAERLPLSLLELDCDDFKEVNDRAGHGFGDALLREIGDVLLAVLPDGAEAARLGGDEFVVMLPTCDAEAAERSAREIQTRLVSGLADAGFPLRLSAGVATYPYDADRSSQLLRVVDQALYEAKARGKGLVVGFREMVRGSTVEERVPVSANRRRSGEAADSALLAKAAEAATAIWAENEAEGTLRRLAQSLTFVIGATACLVSRIQGESLVDAVRHSLRDTDLGEEVAYLIADFPVTQHVLETGQARAISFLDEDLDRAEAFVLRELRMNCCLLLQLTVDDHPWGLVEVYDMRMRRFEPDELAVANFLVAVAGSRLGALGESVALRRRLPVFRLPWAS